jgi:hypothetical protein
VLLLKTKNCKLKTALSPEFGLYLQVEVLFYRTNRRPFGRRFFENRIFVWGQSQCYQLKENTVKRGHAVEQQGLTKLPGVVTEEKMHSIENLRRIPKGTTSYVHKSLIRREWNDSYRPFAASGTVMTDGLNNARLRLEVLLLQVKVMPDRLHNFHHYPGSEVPDMLDKAALIDSSNLICFGPGVCVKVPFTFR